MQHESIKKPRHHRWDSRKTMILVAASALILYYSIFFVFPIGYALVGSFFNWMPTKRVFSFIGFENYSKIFTEHPRSGNEEHIVVHPNSDAFPHRVRASARGANQHARKNKDLVPHDILPAIYHFDRCCINGMEMVV